MPPRNLWVKGKKRCGARNRRGEPCMRRELFANGRCRNHGGLCSGPVTEEGKKRVTMNLPWAKREKHSN
jgi:hypothetical protein